MEIKYKLGLLAVSTAMVLVGCGGAEDIIGGNDGDGDYTPTSFTGQFIDAPVQGLNYTCTGMLNGESNVVTHTGVTNNSGEFTCNDGDSVEFSVGAYVLGGYQLKGTQSEYDKVITPYSMHVESMEAAIDVAQLLQTIDNPSDGVIKIPDNFTALDTVTVKPGDTDFDALVADALPGVSALVPADQAQKHLDDTLNPPTTTPPTESGLVELVSGKIATIIIPSEGTATITFAEDGSYHEVTDTVCDGKWAVVSENGKEYIGATCEENGVGGTPTSPDDSDVVFDFYESGKVKIYADENGQDVEFDATVTFTDI